MRLEIVWVGRQDRLPQPLGCDLVAPAQTDRGDRRQQPPRLLDRQQGGLRFDALQDVIGFVDRRPRGQSGSEHQQLRVVGDRRGHPLPLLHGRGEAFLPHGRHDDPFPELRLVAMGLDRLRQDRCRRRRIPCDDEMIVLQRRELGRRHSLRSLERVEQACDLRPVAVVRGQPQLVHTAKSQQRLPDLRLPQQLLVTDLLGDRLIFGQRLLRPPGCGECGGGGDPPGQRPGITAEHPLAGGQLFVDLTQPAMAFGEQHIDLPLGFVRRRHERPK